MRYDHSDILTKLAILLEALREPIQVQNRKDTISVPVKEVKYQLVKLLLFLELSIICLLSILILVFSTAVLTLLLLWREESAKFEQELMVVNP